MNTIFNEAQVKPDGYSDLIEIALPQVWNLRPHVLAAVDPLLARLELEDKPTVGFHVRGGDKLDEDKKGNRTTTMAHHYISAFADEKRRLAKMGGQPMGNGTCVLVGDDEAFLREAAAIAAQELGCKIFAGRLKYEMESHNQQKFDQLPLADRCTATMHLLTDLELLAHTDYFVGSFNSGLAHLVDKLRYVLYGKHRRTTIDASISKRDWYAQIRAYFNKEHPIFDYDYKFQGVKV